MRTYPLHCFLLLTALPLTAQYATTPTAARFVTEDVDRFWQAFEQMDTKGAAAFTPYLRRGTPGVKGFIKYRIESAEALYATVRERRADYLDSRDVLNELPAQAAKIRRIYANLKAIYPAAVFPPVYFVVGRFTSGGTVTRSGIIVGTEMLENLDELPGLVAHELIHFQQPRRRGKANLLEQSIREGVADYVGEKISGLNLNAALHAYGEAHAARLTAEFRERMYGKDRTDWLYGTSGKDDRPNDLGYWMGYRIAAGYVAARGDERAALAELIRLEDAEEIARVSGVLP